MLWFIIKICPLVAGRYFVMSYKHKPKTPCPDPEKYILVQTKEGAFWRRKRGTVTRAALNLVFTKNVSNSKVASPAAKRIVQKLRPFLRGLDAGRLTARLAGALIKTMNAKGQIDFSLLKGFEIQKHPPLDSLLKAQIHITRQSDEIKITFAVNEYTMELPKKSIATDYYFEGIILYGDVTTDNGLRIDSTISPLYSFTNTGDHLCELTLQLPSRDVPWMVLFKASCQEGNELAVHNRHYGMKVVEVGCESALSVL